MKTSIINLSKEESSPRGSIQPSKKHSFGIKKLLLVLVIAGSAFTVSAQSNYNHSNERHHYKDNRDTRNDLHRPIKKRDLKNQLAVINRDYDARISYIKNHPNMRRAEKNRQIRQLEKQRKIALDQCKSKFMNRNHKGYAAKW
jgi:hypothetical protein